MLTVAATVAGGVTGAPAALPVSGCVV